MDPATGAERRAFDTLDLTPADVKPEFAIAADVIVKAASAGIILVIPAVVTGPRHMPSNVALLSVLILGVLCTSIAMLLMFYLVSHAGASRASVITYINPAVATLLGVVVLHEHLGVGGLLGFALILVGSWLATRGNVTAAKQQSESQKDADTAAHLWAERFDGGAVRTHVAQRDQAPGTDKLAWRRLRRTPAGNRGSRWSLDQSCRFGRGLDISRTPARSRRGR